MPKSILISRGLSAEALPLIPKDVTVDFNGHQHPLSRQELLSRLRGKDGLICQITDAIDDEVLATPGLSVVSNVAVGYNNIDVAAARRRGVVITNTPDVLTETTADFAWALLMAAARRVVEADRYVRSGDWKAWQWDLLWGLDVHGKRLRPHRPRGRAPGPRLRHARALPRRGPRDAGRRA
jgi:glyoxylate reductase